MSEVNHDFSAWKWETEDGINDAFDYIFKILTQAYRASENVDIALRAIEEPEFLWLIEAKCGEYEMSKPLRSPNISNKAAYRIAHEIMADIQAHTGIEFSVAVVAS